jgi:hypothetical protein
MKRKPHRRDKTFASPTSDKSLVLRKETPTMQEKRRITQFRNGQRGGDISSKKMCR